MSTERKALQRITDCAEFCGSHAGVSATRDAMLEMRRIAVDALADQFKPTHRHAEGGLYQVIDTSLRVHIEGVWLQAVRYRNAEGMEFVRAASEFVGRFTDV